MSKFIRIIKQNKKEEPYICELQVDSDTILADVRQFINEASIQAKYRVKFNGSTTLQLIEKKKGRSRTLKTLNITSV